MKLTTETFETRNCIVTIRPLNIVVNKERIYMIKSVHKCDGKVNIRFGNKVQTEGIKNTYKDKRYVG